MASPLERSLTGIQRRLRGAYELDLNVSYSRLGSLFHPQPATAVGDLTAAVKRLYGSTRLSLGTNGTTASNTLMVLSAAVEGESLIMDRHCHASVYGALVLGGATPHYLPPRFDQDRGVPQVSLTSDVEQALATHPQARAVLVTAPNYYGAQPDLLGIREQVRAAGCWQLIDAAHGAHLRASPRLAPAIEQIQPDLMTTSLHKTLGALSQASVLLGFGDNPELDTRLQAVIDTTPVISTSFSTVILASIEPALLELQQTDRWERAIDLAADLRERLSHLPGCRVIDLAAQIGVAACDPLRVCLDVSATGLTGYALADQLEVAGHITEMSTDRHVLLLLTSATSQAGIDSFLATLTEIIQAANLKPRSTRTGLHPPDGLPSMVLTPRQAFLAARRAQRRVPVADAVGNVSAETLAAYPPGAPIVIAGEKLRGDDLEYLQAVRRLGGVLKGAADADLNTVAIIDD